jgi:hypothetical protein
MHAAAIVLICSLVFARGLEAREVTVRAPAFLSRCGPQQDGTALSRQSRPLHISGRDTHSFCEPVQLAEERAAIDGHAVLVEITPGGCAWETVYLNLVETGASGILIHYAGAADYLEPGRWHSTVGPDLDAIIEAASKTVPMLHLGHSAAKQLSASWHNSTLFEHDVLHVVLELDENPWVTLFNADAWSVVMRRITPLAYFVVAATCTYLIAHTGFRAGSTQQWVIFIEFFPALILCVASLVGMFEGEILSRDKLNLFGSHFLFVEAASTVMVARYWTAQAAAAESCFQDGLAPDPQLSWNSQVLTLCAVGTDILFSITGSLGTTSTVMYVLYALVATVLSPVYCVIFVRASIRIVQACNKAPVVTAYAITSACCIFGQIVALVMFSAAQPLSPTLFFVIFATINISRAGSGLCKLFVFLPRSSKTEVLPMPSSSCNEGNSRDVVHSSTDPHSSIEGNSSTDQHSSIEEGGTSSTDRLTLDTLLLSTGGGLGLPRLPPLQVPSFFLPFFLSFFLSSFLISSLPSFLFFPLPSLCHSSPSLSFPFLSGPTADRCEGRPPEGR